MVNGLKRGDEVITSGGIIGTVDRVMEDDRIEVLISNDIKVQVIKSTITSLLKKKKLKNNSFCVKFFKKKILSIYLILILISFFTFLNFQNENKKFIDNK